MTVKRVFSAVFILLLFTFGLGFASAPTDYDLPVMDEVLGVVNSVKQEFPAIKGSVVAVGELDDRIYAVTTTTVTDRQFSGQITINEHFSSDRQRLRDSIDSDVSLGFHPSLGHCTAAQFVAYHESAHLVDASEGDASHSVLFRRFGDGHQLRGILSGYSFYGDDAPWVGGMINIPEALAEAFAAVHCNGGNTTERELNKMLQLGEIHELRN